MDIVKELWPTALRQIELALLDMEDGLPKTDNPMMAFIDWKDGLDRQAGAHAVWIYCLRQGEVLARLAGDVKGETQVRELLADALEKAVKMCIRDSNRIPQHKYCIRCAGSHYPDYMRGQCT